DRAGAQAFALGEPQIAVRAGAIHVARLVRARPLATAPAWDPARTVVITGGTGTLGALVARHLITAHGVRHLCLLGRHGRASAGAEALADELSDLGAALTIAACDVSDRAALAAALDACDPPVGGIVHAAGVTDDGLVGALTAERLDRVWAGKAAAAVHLDALTRERQLSAFVMFSSAAATLGSPGQASYAAANACLDALAARRRAAGLAATSIAWGLWQPASAITRKLDRVDHARIARAHVLPLAPAHGLALLDAALATDRAQVVAARFDLLAMRGASHVATVFRRLVPASTTAARPRGLAQRLAALPAADRLAAIRDAVHDHVAAVLGHASGAAIDGERTFKELAFDSLTGVELRNRLAADAGLRLPATLIYDYPTPAALARYLDLQLRPPEADPGAALLAQIEQALARDAAFAARLRALVASAPRAAEADLTAKSDDELFELVNHLGK
ncbi:MAG TPA: beta-ketoacyl reductase, partial [Kofleriaceae bacterium]|nr:beta-ketoacyl reductase [Kofleriaceae bacterium]